MAVGAVLISFSVAIIGAFFLGSSSGFMGVLLAYAGLGTLILISFALVVGTLGRRDKSR
ncbi:MAG: hypothetical protein AAFY06_07315 [Pseudomonadota bacterium]